MAHLLETLDNGQTHHFFEVGAQKSAWHRLGNLWTTPPKTFTELMDKAPWLDYEVVKTATQFATKDGVIYDSEKAFVTYRPDRAIELGSVGPDYVVLQNREAFEASIAPLIDAGILRAETGGVLREGADAWIMCAFDLNKFGPIVREVFADEIAPYALVRVNHSGKRGIDIGLVDQRVVCANTLAIAENELSGTKGKTRSALVRHTGDAKLKVVEAAKELFGGLIERHEKVAQGYRAMKQATLDVMAFEALVLYPSIGAHPTQRDEFNPDARNADRMVERYEDRVKEITWLWENGKGHTGDHSAWEGYNGVVEAIDHNEKLFPSRSGAYRLGALLDGELRNKKDRVYTGLLDYVKDPGAFAFAHIAAAVHAK